MRSRSYLNGAALASLCFSMACGAPEQALQEPTPPSVQTAKGSGARRVTPTTPKTTLEKKARQTPRLPAPLVIDRRALDRVLDAGPGALLHNIPLLPVITRTPDQRNHPQQRHFVGYRIGRIYDNSKKVLRYGVLPGDLLRSINGQRILTPDELMKVFKNLRTATNLRIQVQRHGEPLHFSWPIVDSAIGISQTPVPKRANESRREETKSSTEKPNRHPK